MSLLAIVLIMLSLIKLVMAYTLSNSDVSSIQVALPLNMEEFKKGVLSFLVLDGLVGIFCGVYLLL